MRLAVAAYLCIVAAFAFHLYRSPYWNLDMLGYMGNAELNEITDPVKLHHRVYGELRSSAPREVFDLLTGAPGFQDDGGAKRDRFLNPDHFGQFLPFFAVRPMYNKLLYWLSRTGIGLIPAVRLVSAGSYALLGVLVVAWLLPYTRMAPLLALIIMLIPHIVLLGRFTGSDGLSVLLGMLSLYLILEREKLGGGLAILMAAIWFRTDNIALVVPVLCVLCLQKRIALWMAGVLAIVAVASVLVINRAAGDHGIAMLYYRNFIGIPKTPNEVIVHFSFAQYAHFFLSGFKHMFVSFVPLFILLGLIGLNRRTAALLGIVTAYSVLHYLILPNWVDRFFGIFYLVTAMTAASQVQPPRFLNVSAQTSLRASL